MGTFCTTTSLYENLIGVDQDTATTTLLTNAIGEAEDEIRAAVSSRYNISSDNFQTATSVPPLVRTMCLDYSEGLFYRRNSRGDDNWYKLGIKILERVEKKFKSIQKGEIHLLDTQGSIISEKDNGNFAMTSSSSGYAETFNEDDPLKWIIDSDKLDDISDGRD